MLGRCCPCFPGSERTFGNFDFDKGDDGSLIGSSCCPSSPLSPLPTVWPAKTDVGQWQVKHRHGIDKLQTANSFYCVADDVCSKQFWGSTNLFRIFLTINHTWFQFSFDMFPLIELINHRLNFATLRLWSSWQHVCDMRQKQFINVHDYMEEFDIKAESGICTQS